jgi:hypothetical protein
VVAVAPSLAVVASAAGTSLQERAWGRITRTTLGYGYQPWRALLFLSAVAVLSCVLAVMARAAWCADRLVRQVSVGLDLNLPAGTSLARASCGLAGNPASVTAAWLAAAGLVLRLLAWAFAALFIAGFTGAARKT